MDGKPSKNKKRLNAMLPIKMVDELDEYAESVGLSRTTILAIIIRNYLDQQKGLNIMRDKQSIEKLVSVIDEHNRNNRQ